MLEPSSGLDRVSEVYDALVNMNMQESGARADEDDEMELPRLEKRWEYNDEEDA
jgi:hypothetical protein